MRYVPHKDQWLGTVPWCKHREAFRVRRCGGGLWGSELRPWHEMQRRWLASDGSPAVRDALLAEWSTLDFDLVRRGKHKLADWTLFRSADERANAAATAEAMEVDDWAWMVHEITRSSNLTADVGDMCTRWRQDVASACYTSRHCFNCLVGEEPKPTLASVLRRGACAPSKSALPPCSKSASQQHLWTWTVPRAQRDRELRRIPELVMGRVSTLESMAELVEAWALAFEARWGEARGATAGVREAALQARANVQRVARLCDAMEAVAREARLNLKVLLPP